MTSAAITEDWVDAKAVGRAIGMHAKTVYRLARSVPGFPIIRVGPREVRFVLSQVKAFIADHPERLAAATAEAAVARSLSAAKKAAAKPASKRGKAK